MAQGASSGVSQAALFPMLERRSQSSSGFLMADLSLTPMYANDAAAEILNYGSESHHTTEWETRVQERLRRILRVTEYTSDTCSLVPFVSGRRRYVCRAFLLGAGEGDTRSSIVALLMERSGQQHAGLLEASRRFHLSPREYETVVHLAYGLTTKEIAQRMKVSPNTVKQFVRSTMSKMSVTTRSGILGKLFSS